MNSQNKNRTPLISPPDAELVRAAQRGDKGAFVEIVARHQGMVCGIALGILGDFAAGEDAAQEAFLTAWRKMAELQEPERLRGWLGQIARNTALAHLRRQPKIDSLEHAPEAIDHSPAPDEAAATREEVALVCESLARLPEIYRLPLVLFYREGQSVRTVADALGIGESAVKQRLARGREMLRDRMSALMETVLIRTKPTAGFTVAVAAAIGALASPAAIAGSVFAATSAGASTPAASSATFLTAMTTTKTSIVTVALIAAACVPIGYHLAGDGPPLDERNRNTITEPRREVPLEPEIVAPSFESSALFAEWRRLHEVHGTGAEAMPELYQAIQAIQDSFRRRAFRAALMAEWAQVDPQGGLTFLMANGDSSHSQQFFKEWLALDPLTAVDALMTAGSGWEKVARANVLEIAQRAPSRVAAIFPYLPTSTSYWDTSLRDAFVHAADADLNSARASAEAMTGPNREDALAGVALAWSKTDLQGAIAWAKTLPEGVDRDEIIRAALLGKARTDPVAALESVGLAPPGGREGYFATTTGARVLTEAAKADYDATVAWLAANPGRLSQDDMMGLARAVTERLNADPAVFLTRHSQDGSLEAVLPAVGHALLNDASGQHGPIWEWLKYQPENETFNSLKEQILRYAGWKDPELALRLAHDLPPTPEGEAQMRTLAQSFLQRNGQMHQFELLLEQAPEPMRPPLLETAFNYLRSDTLDDVKKWIGRLSALPEGARARGVSSIARTWASEAPEEAIDWVNSMPPGNERSAGVGAVASGWAAKDPYGAATWVASMAPGPEFNQTAEKLVFAIADDHPYDAWQWTLSIGDDSQRQRLATWMVHKMKHRDVDTARQWIERSPFAPDVRLKLQAALEAPRQRGPVYDPGISNSR